MQNTKQLTGPALRSLREQAGLTLWDLASRLGTHESGLSLIERGMRPMPENLPDRYRQVLVEIVEERQRAVLLAVGS